MIQRITEFFTARAAAVTAAAGTGGAVAHFCVHPCPEHAGIAIVIWAVGIVAAVKEKF